MQSEWQATTLGEVLELKRGYDLPQKNRIKGDVPLISSAGVSDFHNEAKVKAPGVVTGRYGTIGEVFYSDKDFWPLNTTLYVRDFKGNDAKFIYYFLKTIDYLQYSDKAAVPGVNRNHLHLAKVSIPEDIQEQKAIAHILGSLDDKIELNRQMNATLEAMAQALFKSWFVDFDPVLDNALAAGNPIPDELQDKAAARAALGDARKPLPENIAALFPAAFVWTEEMGWIPEGWGITKAEDIAERIAMGPFGSNIKVSTFVESGVPVISGQHLNATLLTEDSYNFITEEHAKKIKNSAVTRGDIVFTHAGNIGQVSMIPKNSQYPNYMISQRQFYLRPDKKKAFSSFLVYFFRSHQGQYELLANASQVGVPSIARPSSHLKSIEFMLPKYELMEHFDNFCSGIFDSLLSYRAQTDNLQKLRDTLLPKLLSGELRIPDAEKRVGT